MEVVKYIIPVQVQAFATNISFVALSQLCNQTTASAFNYRTHI